MYVYLHTKFQVSSLILTSLPPTSKGNPKKPTQIRVNKQKVFKNSQTDFKNLAIFTPQDFVNCLCPFSNIMHKF